MTYDRNRILIFGGAGVAIAALFIIFFIPVKTEIHAVTSVSLQEIPGYGFQIVKISEEQDDVTHLKLALNGFEIRQEDGDWIEISGGSVSFDLIRDQEASFAVTVGDLYVGSYDGLRFRVVRGLEFTNATLNSGDPVLVDTPQPKVEFTVSTFEIGEATDSLHIVLRRGSGVMSNYMLPEFHLAIGTLKIEIDVSG